MPSWPPWSPEESRDLARRRRKNLVEPRLFLSAEPLLAGVCSTVQADLKRARFVGIYSGERVSHRAL
jgi:hypothetical protein